MAYADRSTPLKVSAHRLGTSPAVLGNLARRHGWPTRGKAYGVQQWHLWGCWALRHKWRR